MTKQSNRNPTLANYAEQAHFVNVAIISAQALSDTVTPGIQRRVNASVIGQEHVVERLVIALPANGRPLAELDLPRRRHLPRSDRRVESALPPLNPLET